MQEELIVIDKNFNEKTVLNVLCEKLGLSKNAMKNLKFGGKILLNGEAVTVRYRVKEGDELKIEFSQKFSDNIKPVKMPIDIIFEDDDILAVNKPAMMATHPSVKNHENTLANAVMAYYNGNFTFRAITRLDKYTSGVVLIAKSAVSAAKLSKLMKMGEIEKTYLALVCGNLEKRGEIKAPIGRCSDSIIKRKITPDGKSAHTIYEVIGENNGKSLVRVNIKTGRTHQIRVHMAYLGAPVYGDFLYGKEVLGARTCLHCESLKFKHPSTGQDIKLFAPLAEDMKKLIKDFN